MDDQLRNEQEEHRRRLDEEMDFYSRKGLSRGEAIKRVGAGAVVLGTMGGLYEALGGTAAAAIAEIKASKPLKMLDVGFGDVVFWCDELRDATKFWGQLLNVDVTHIDGGANPATQVARLETALSGKWDFAAMTPVASNTLAPAAKKLIARGVPVIQQAVDIGKPGQDIGYLTFISQNYVDVGYKLSSYLFEKVGGHGTFIETEGVAGTGNVIGRHKGVLQAMKQFPNMKRLAVDYTDYSDAQGRTLWDAYVQKYKEIDVAVTLTTGSQALNGTYAALKAAGRAGKTLIGSNNADPNACQAVAQGKLAATIRHSAVLLGMWAVVVGALYKRGAVKKVPKTLWMPDQLITNKSEAESLAFLQTVKGGVLLA